MHNYKISNFHSILSKEINIFRTGLFILPSAPAIAFVLIVVSLLINSLKTNSINDVLGHPWFAKTLLDSWWPGHDKHLNRCIRTCAYNHAYHNEIKVEA